MKCYTVGGNAVTFTSSCAVLAVASVSLLLDHCCLASALEDKQDVTISMTDGRPVYALYGKRKAMPDIVNSLQRYRGIMPDPSRMAVSVSVTKDVPLATLMDIYDLIVSNVTSHVACDADGRDLSIAPQRSFARPRMQPCTNWTATTSTLIDQSVQYDPTTGTSVVTGDGGRTKTEMFCRLTDPGHLVVEGAVMEIAQLSRAVEAIKPERIAIYCPRDMAQTNLSLLVEGLRKGGAVEVTVQGLTNGSLLVGKLR